jgi:gas vesicle protein
MNSYMDGVRDALERVGFIRSSTSSWMTGFAIGAGVGLLAGATAALLTTPASGRELRGQLGSRAKQLAERTQGVIADASQGLRGKQSGDAYDLSEDVVLGT